MWGAWPAGCLACASARAVSGPHWAGSDRRTLRMVFPSGLWVCVMSVPPNLSGGWTCDLLPPSVSPLGREYS